MCSNNGGAKTPFSENGKLLGTPGSKLGSTDGSPDKMSSGTTTGSTARSGGNSASMSSSAEKGSAGTPGMTSKVDLKNGTY